MTWRAILTGEVEALKHLENSLPELSMQKAVALIGDRNIIISGIGKSGIAAQKIAATMQSLGLAARYVHAGDALHGDLGNINGDALILLSQSGATEDIVDLFLALKNNGNGCKIIGITTPGSALALAADLFFDSTVKDHSEYKGCVPCASFLVQVAIGDALAIALAESQAFSYKQLLETHPAGSIGNWLKRPVSEIMLPAPFTLLRNDFEIWINNIKPHGIVGLVDNDLCLVGCFTDGDWRRVTDAPKRAFLDGDNNFLMRNCYTKNPEWCHPECSTAAALDLCQKHSITALFVCGENRKLIGLVKLHDLMRR